MGSEEKAIIERKVVRVATPGTLTEEIELGDTNNNYLMALIAVDKSYGAAWEKIARKAPKKIFSKMRLVVLLAAAAAAPSARCSPARSRPCSSS